MMDTAEVGALVRPRKDPNMEEWKDPARDIVKLKSESVMVSLCLIKVMLSL